MRQQTMPQSGTGPLSKNGLRRTKQRKRGRHPMQRQNIQPEALAQRVVNGHVLYSHVVVVEGQRMIFVAGPRGPDSPGDSGGEGDMGVPLRPGGGEIGTAVAAGRPALRRSAE